MSEDRKVLTTEDAQIVLADRIKKVGVLAEEAGLTNLFLSVAAPVTDSSTGGELTAATFLGAGDSFAKMLAEGLLLVGSSLPEGTAVIEDINGRALMALDALDAAKNPVVSKPRREAEAKATTEAFLEDISLSVEDHKPSRVVVICEFDFLDAKEEKRTWYSWWGGEDEEQTPAARGNWAAS